jgi:aminoglycoside phosphotransferase (APT) family kinase protein
VGQFAVPETLHHDDFHDGNVFYRDGRYIFADWAESAVAHPFFSLVVALRSIAYRAEVAEDDLLISRLRDSYLEPWHRFASRAELLELADLTRPLGALCRALTWAAAVSVLRGAERTEHADAVPGWLGVLLEMDGLLRS